MKTDVSLVLMTHAALNRFLSNKDYSVKKAYVFSNEREIVEKDKITYFPIYMIMFVENQSSDSFTIEPITTIEYE